MMNYIGTVLLFCSCFASIFFGQHIKVSSDEAFNQLPAAKKADLFDRLELYVRLRRDHQWAQLYDLYWKQYIRGENGLRGVSKEQFTASQSNAKPPYELVNFKPQHAQVMSNEREGFIVVKIEGCGEYSGLSKTQGVNQNLKSVVTAAFENGTWFFNDIAIGPRCFDCPPEPCCLPSS